MQLISKFYKGICVIDICIKYAWVTPLKDKKSTTIVNAFPKVINKLDRQLNKIWVSKGSEFYNSYFKKWLLDKK